MLASIALYPDSLLAQVLVAATYPIEVVQADRWVKKNKKLQGDELNAALDKQSWDLSVKALVPFPQHRRSLHSSSSAATGLRALASL
jgi:hypothetical protein